MSELLPDDAWVNSFLHSPPRPLLNALQRRLHASQTHVNALAEVFKQRAAIETQYAESLSKLARSAEQGALLGKNGVEWERGGGEAKIWDSVINEVSETSTSHSTLAAMIRTDFEQPVKDLPNKIVAWRKIGDQESSLDKTLKEYEKTSAKLDKAAGKSKSSKADALSTELNQLTSSLSSLSPMVYTTFQRLDEERLKALKEIAVRWGTLKGDATAREGERAEASVAGMLGWETGDEVLAVGRRLGGVSGSASTAPSLSAIPSPRTARSQQVSTPANSDFGPRPHRTNTSNSTAGQGPTSFTGGFKSMLGRSKTVMARGRSDSNATSVRSGQEREAIREPVAEERQQQDSRPIVDSEGFSVPPEDRHRSPWDQTEDFSSGAVLEPSAPKTATSGFANVFNESPTGSREDLGSSQPGQPKLNLAIATAPIEESDADRQAALEKVQQSLGSPTLQPNRRGTVARGRRDVRNTVFGPQGLEGFADGSGSQSSPNGIMSVNAPHPSIFRQASVSSATSNNPFDSPGLMSGPATAFKQTIGNDSLSATLTETVNVILKNGGVQRLQVNGEIRFGSTGTAPSEPVHLRIVDFERLEKIAPNPAFLAQVPERPGEYLLKLTGLPDNGTFGTLLFKYQVHVPLGTEAALLPLKLEPAFQCKDGETRMILKYDAACSLSDVTIVAAFDDGPAVSNVQAKPPGGVWSPSTRKMTWKIGHVEPGEGKIIAKFAVESAGSLKPLGMQALWSIQGALSSGIGIEVVDGPLKMGEVKKALTSGKYIAEPMVREE